MSDLSDKEAERQAGEHVKQFPWIFPDEVVDDMQLIARRAFIAGWKSCQRYFEIKAGVKHEDS